jgi:hypothetical protein
VSLLLAAGASALALAAAAPARATPACSRAEARARLAAIELLNEGDAVAQAVCLDLDADGLRDLAATVEVPGTAGVIGVGVFLARTHGWKTALRLEAYRPRLVALGRELLVYYPIYRKNDPNCCPTGGERDLLYRWNGRRLALARSWQQP